MNRSDHRHDDETDGDAEADAGDRQTEVTVVTGDLRLIDRQWVETWRSYVDDDDMLTARPGMWSP